LSVINKLSIFFCLDYKCLYKTSFKILNDTHELTEKQGPKVVVKNLWETKVQAIRVTKTKS